MEISRVQVLPGAAEAGAGGDTEARNLGSERREEGSALGHTEGAGLGWGRRLTVRVMRGRNKRKHRSRRGSPGAGDGAGRWEGIKSAGKPRGEGAKGRLLWEEGGSGTSREKA